MEDRHLLTDRVDTGLLHFAEDIDPSLQNLLRVGAGNDLRHDERVVSLERQVLREVGLLNEPSQVHRDALAGPDDVRRRQVRSLGEPAGESEGLQHGHARLERVDPGLDDSTDDEDAEAADLLYQDGDVRVLDGLAELFHDGIGELRGRETGGPHLADERKRDLAVQPDGDFLIQLLFVG